MDGIALVMALSVMVEATVEYVKCFYDYVVQKEYKKLITRIAALAVSISLCVSAGADLFAEIGVNFHFGAVGTVMTGIFASRGANYINDLLSALTKKTKSTNS